MKLRMIIYDSFRLNDKGTVVVGRRQEETSFEVGTTVLLITPTGERYTLDIREVDTFSKCFSQVTQLGLLLGDHVQPADIPPGTELWS